MKTLHYPGDVRDCVGQYVGPTQLSAIEFMQIAAVEYDPVTDTSTASLKFVGPQEVLTAKWAMDGGEPGHGGMAVHTITRRRTR